MQHIAPHMLREIQLHLSINFERMIRDQANQIEQLQYNAKLNEKEVTFITGQIGSLKLEPNTEECPGPSTKMNGIKNKDIVLTGGHVTLQMLM